MRGWLAPSARFVVGYSALGGHQGDDRPHLVVAAWPPFEHPRTGGEIAEGSCSDDNYKK